MSGILLMMQSSAFAKPPDPIDGTLSLDDMQGLVPSFTPPFDKAKMVLWSVDKRAFVVADWDPEQEMPLWLWLVSATPQGSIALKGGTVVGDRRLWMNDPARVLASTQTWLRKKNLG